MTYSVPDPADETAAPVVAGPTTDDPPLPNRLGAAADDFGPVDTDQASSGGAHRALDGQDDAAASRTAGDEPPANETAANETAANETPVDADVADAMAVDADADPATLGEPLRVAHEDSEEFEQFVSDPAAAEAATRERMDAQAEAEKAAAGITPAENG